MTYVALSDNHPFLEAGNDVANLLTPLSMRYGVSQFTYGKFYENGKCILLSNYTRWVKHHLDHGYTAPAPIPLSLLDKPESFNLIPYDGPFHQARHDLVNIFNTGDGIDFIYKNDDNYEVICYAFPVDNHDGVNQILNNIDTFKHFSRYFMQEANTIIENADKHKIDMPLNMRGINFKNNIETINKATPTLPWENRNEISIKLSNRERQCAYLLMKGMTAKEIAIYLQLSSRTIEIYLHNLKSRLHCKNKTELIIKLTSMLDEVFKRC